MENASSHIESECFSRTRILTSVFLDVSSGSTEAAGVTGVCCGAEPWSVTYNKNGHFVDLGCTSSSIPGSLTLGSSSTSMLRFISLAITLLLASVAMASPIDKRDYTGKATWSEQGLVGCSSVIILLPFFFHPCLLEGACGITTTNDELVVGVSAAYFDSYP
jgi:hypothetical protein